MSSEIRRREHVTHLSLFSSVVSSQLSVESCYGPRTVDPARFRIQLRGCVKRSGTHQRETCVRLSLHAPYGLPPGQFLLRTGRKRALCPSDTEQVQFDLPTTCRMKPHWQFKMRRFLPVDSHPKHPRKTKGRNLGAKIVLISS